MMRRVILAVVFLLAVLDTRGWPREI